ncbi:MAG: hypothetical protein U1E56_00575 [Bauldia sp.]
MRRLLLLLLASLFLAGIVHVGTILTLPALAARDIRPLFASFGAPGAFRLLPAATPQQIPLPLADPQMTLAACVFSLGKGPARIRAALPRGFWSLGVYGPGGRSLFSLNDRSAGRGDLDMVIATTAQLTALRANPPASMEQAIISEVGADTGVVILRVFAGDPTRRAEIEAALGRANCAAAV